MLLRGLPGVGKSTALRRLAAELAALVEGPLPIIVHLPDFAGRWRRDQNALECLVDVAMGPLPDEVRALLAAEFLAQLRHHGHAALMLDSLDEVRTDRPAVLTALQSVLDELHDDAEVVLCTRDSAYAGAAALGLAEATLEPPSDMTTPLRALAEHLLADRIPDEARRRAQVDGILEVVETNHDSEPFDRTPLAQVARTVLAAEQGTEHLARGRAQSLSNLVDFIARQWEIEQRQAEHVSGSLGSRESKDLLVASFDVIAGQLAARLEAPATDVLTGLTNWIREEWELPPARARSAAKAAVEFWDQTGVYVHCDAPARVQARQASLHEVGLARWVARTLSPGDRRSWLEERLDQPDAERTLELLAGLDDEAADALVEAAASGPLGVLRLAIRALAGRPRASEDGEDVRLLTRLVDCVVDRASAGDEQRWRLFQDLLELPLREDDVERLFAAFDPIDTARAELAGLLAQLYWSYGGPVDIAVLTRAVAAGPPPPGVDSLFDAFVVASAGKASPATPELIDALATQQMIRLGAFIEVERRIVRNGGATQLYEAMKQVPNATRIGDEMLADMRLGRDRLLELISKLGTPRATYTQRRQLRELCDFVETTIPRDLPIKTSRIVLFRAPELAFRALQEAAELGGFDTEVLAAQVWQLIEEEGDEAWRAAVYYGSVARELDHWPDGAAAQEQVIDTLTLLLRASEWTGGIAAQAFRSCPLPKLAAERVRAAIPTMKVGSARMNAAKVLLALAED